MPGLQPNERALLMMLVARLRQIDADVFIGHNFAAFDLDVLLHRMQHHKVTRLQAENTAARLPITSAFYSLRMPGAATWEVLACSMLVALLTARCPSWPPPRCQTGAVWAD